MKQVTIALFFIKLFKLKTTYRKQHFNWQQAISSSSNEATSVKDELVVVGVKGVGELIRGGQVLPDIIIQVPDQVGPLRCRKDQGQNQKELKIDWIGFFGSSSSLIFILRAMLWQQSGATWYYVSFSWILQNLKWSFGDRAGPTLRKLFFHAEYLTFQTSKTNSQNLTEKPGRNIGDKLIQL